MRLGRTLFVAFAALLAASAALRPPRAAAPRRPNVLLVSIDTLRADHLGAYGHTRPTSPRLDAFARGAIRYARVLAPTPWTLPSHAALLTGRHPFELGILDSEGVVPAQVPTLGELLRARGYATAAFVDSDPEGFLGARRGFDRGFDSFSHAPFKRRRRHEYDMKASAEAALAWLDARDATRPFFLFLHTKSVHATSTQAAESDAPYDKPAAFRLHFLPGRRMRFPWREGQVFGTALLRQWNEALATGEVPRERFAREELLELEALYDGGIRYTDEHLGRLLDAMERRGLLRDSVVAITADHGEAFLEHDFFLHQELYAPLLEVPLLLRLPGGPGGVVVPDTVFLEDLMPTLLHLAGLRPPADITGRVLPPKGGPALPRPRLSFFRIGGRNLYEAYAIEDGPLKLLHHRRAVDPGFRTVLFDRRSDPGETRAATSAAREALLQALVAYYSPGEAKAPGALTLSPEAIENLRALGYVQ